MNEKFVYPKYVMIEGKHTALVYEEKGEYYRDAGQWSCSTKIQNGKLLIDEPFFPTLDGKELIEISHKIWAEDNKGYI